MHDSIDTEEVSIRYRLVLEDGTLLGSNARGDGVTYTRGLNQILPALEEAMLGAAPGEKRTITLSPTSDPHLKLDASRLAMLLGHPGETLILTVEIL